jgi:hypothetical protein
MGKPSEPGFWAESLGSFELGVNSDVPAVALPKNQAAWAENCTFRGNYATHRPPFNDLEFSFATTDIQTAFERGLFQGATYYKPDYGPEKIICAVSGRFYAVTPSGPLATVEDITPVGDENSTTTSISWMWQSECFCIINDGQNAPAIYNGNNVVRANQGELIATIATGGTFPQEGSSLAVTFTADYTGPLNTALYLYNPGTPPQLLGTVEVNISNSTSGYAARLTNIDDTPGNDQPTGSELIIGNSWEGESVSAGTPTTFNDGTFGSYPVMQQNETPADWASLGYRRQTVQLTPQFTGAAGSRIQWTELNREKSGFVALETVVISVNSTTGEVLVQRDDGPSLFNVVAVAIPAGSPAKLMNTTADVVLATTTEDFVAPDVGEYVDVTLDTYLNLNGQIVTINGKRYSVSVIPPVSTSTLFIKTIQRISQGETIVIATGATLRTIPQLPPSRMGAYGLGRNWISLPDGQSYLGGNIVGGSTGSIAYNYRDSVLFVTENNYLAGGGVFRVPAAGQQINAMAFPATLDSSLGQGPLQVLTQDITFSCNAPVQRADWQTMVNPIQTQSLVGGGSLGDVVIINGDLWFRSTDGIRSLKLARQDFVVSYSNTPQSVEVNRVLMDDNQSLLQFWHGVNFDNRALMVATPASSSRGTFHKNLVALNLDPNSSLRQKQPPIYDGVWQGRNILKVVTGTFSTTKRTYAFTYLSDTNTIGMTEILPTKTQNRFDNGTERIGWNFESPALFYQPDTKTRELLCLTDGEMFVKDLSGTVAFRIEYRPDWLDDWTVWHQWEVSSSPNFQPRMGFGTPPVAGNDATGRPNKVGYSFQLRVSVIGPCTIMGINLFAATQPVTTMAPPRTRLTEWPE